MDKSTSAPSTVNEWLAYIESLHPASIEMGLDRVNAVIQRLELAVNFPIISIAGTNGKGSTCAILESIYAAAGYQVATYTSPHFLQYNERITVNQVPIEDTALCQAFAAVDKARGDIALTYFEVGTLAAMWHFAQCDIDIAILEVGMGGRLDAVNAFDPDCSIVTSVDLDHTAYLGDTREAIGFEKAGIYRTERPAICGDNQPPASLISHAKDIAADLSLIHQDFQVERLSSGWRFSYEEIALDLPSLSLEGDFQLNNAACAIRAVIALRHLVPVQHQHIKNALVNVRLMGRYYQWSELPNTILDVAHNPQAAASLAENLHQHACDGKTLGVVAMLADKDIGSVLSKLAPHISTWYLADSSHERGAKATVLAEHLKGLAISAPVNRFATVSQAIEAAYIDCAKNDRIIVFGSFYTVADALEVLQAKGV